MAEEMDVDLTGELPSEFWDDLPDEMPGELPAELKGGSASDEQTAREVKALYDSIKGDKWAKRVYMALSYGYLDAKHMVYLKETLGLPLDAYVDIARRTDPGLRVPFESLRYHLLCTGQTERSVELTMRELRSLDA
jgi:hypothetical protein